MIADLSGVFGSESAKRAFPDAAGTVGEMLETMPTEGVVANLTVEALAAKATAVDVYNVDFLLLIDDRLVFDVAEDDDFRG